MFVSCLTLLEMELLSSVFVVTLGRICSDFNALRRCDLSEQSITNAQKCQPGEDKFYQGLTTQNYQTC